MSLLTRSADLVYTFRFLRLLTTDFKDTTAYKLGIIDENGRRIKSKSVSSSAEKSAYNTFHKMVFNIKRLLAMAPGGSSKFATYAAALFLIREKLELSDDSVEKILKESGIEILDLLQEQSDWFIDKNNILFPGVYVVKNDKILNNTCDDVVRKNDKIRVKEGCYPAGNIFGINVYESTHIPTNQKLYITVGEITR